MGFYNVVTVPCVVGKLHQVRPTTAPIEVDDDLAAPLVESGHLERYQPGGGEAGAVLDDEFGVTVGLPALVDGLTDMASRLSDGAEAQAADEAETEPKPRRSRSRRRSEG